MRATPAMAGPAVVEAGTGGADGGSDHGGGKGR